MHLLPCQRHQRHPEEPARGGERDNCQHPPLLPPARCPWLAMWDTMSWSPRTAQPGDTGANHGGMSQGIMALCGLSGRGRWGGDVLPVCAITMAKLCGRGCHPHTMPFLMLWGGHMQCLQLGTTLGSKQSFWGNVDLNSDVDHTADTHPWSRPSPKHRCVSHLTTPGACRAQLEAPSLRHLLLCC